MGWSALIGLAVTFAGAYVSRFFRLRWLFPFGIDDPFGPLGDAIFNCSWVFALLIIYSLWKSD
jgi:hypothetical protein